MTLLVKKQSLYEEMFINAVKTTGIFCRHSCRARKPLAKNVTFYKDAQEVLKHGFRHGKQAVGLGNPKALRAFARANGMNRIAIVIPCHRVIGSDGSLTGYAGGLPRKRWPLDLESKQL